MKKGRLKKLHDLPCDSCPFRPDGLNLSVEKMNEIHGYLLQGFNHMCHSDQSNHTICRGGRDWQLKFFARIGIIAESTDAALESAMKEHGMTPVWNRK